MYIKKYDMYKFDRGGYSLMPRADDSSIYYIGMFFTRLLGVIELTQSAEWIEDFKTIYKNGFMYEEINVSIDNESDLVYFSEELDSYEHEITTPELDQLAEDGNTIELCRRGIARHITMTKNNFFYLLTAWGRLCEKLPPFALMYEDDKNWFDILPFESKEAMEKFVADHIK